MTKLSLRPVRRALTPPSTEVVAGIIVFLAAAYFIMSGVLWNSETHIYLTASLVDRGSVNIDPFARFTGDIAYAHGHYFADKAPGLSIAAIPIYWLYKLLFMHGEPLAVFLTHKPPKSLPGAQIMMLRYTLSVFLSAIPTAIVSGLLVSLARKIGATRWWALAIGLIYGLGTIAHAFATLFFSHQLSAVLGFGAFYLVYHVRHGLLARGYLVLAGFLLGYAIVTEHTMAIVALSVGVYAIAGARRWLGDTAKIMAGAIPALSLELIYNTLAFGSPFSLGYSNLAGPTVFREGQSHGFFGITMPTIEAAWGITFSPYRGLFFLSPVLLLAIPALVMLARRREWQAESLVCAIVSVSYLLLNMSYFAWDGGFSMGPRHVLPAVPFMVLPLAELTRRVHHVAWARITAVVGMWSILVVGVSVAVRPLFDQRFSSPLTQLVVPSVCGIRVRPEITSTLTPGQLAQTCNAVAPYYVTARFGTNWGARLGLPGVMQLIPLAIVLMVVAVWYLWGLSDEARERTYVAVEVSSVESLMSVSAV
ncbi:MAG TPA: hypothetical protein VF807_12155 [Ktedonobacterales bacterium]